MADNSLTDSMKKILGTTASVGQTSAYTPSTTVTPTTTTTASLSKEAARQNMLDAQAQFKAAQAALNASPITSSYHWQTPLTIKQQLRARNPGNQPITRDTGPFSLSFSTVDQTRRDNPEFIAPYTQSLDAYNKALTDYNTYGGGNAKLLVNPYASSPVSPQDSVAASQAQALAAGGGTPIASAVPGVDTARSMARQLYRSGRSQFDPTAGMGRQGRRAKL